ncbi:hypothetical protein EVAR_46569_1 [Eumeta japonica]|uniref:Ig-like domain-containing protein n=1 Tax=Eumeta variegata TaxID=151549 RepID=A0A4C1WRX7_EUMVA|nr:hypothetical protein EVAR_46569_1 [Eumeta japonica]
MEQSILGLRKRNKVHYTKIKEKTKQILFVLHAMKLNWKWSDHLARIENVRCTRHVEIPYPFYHEGYQSSSIAPSSGKHTIRIDIIGVRGLHNLEINVPYAVLTGETVTLECSWQLEDEETLYSVKWYRGREEFYRYIPKELPHTRVFPLPGIEVDISRSGARRVVLQQATPDMAGRFRCEVSADAPTFHTEIRSAPLEVVGEIRIIYLIYLRVGDHVKPSDTDVAVVSMTPGVSGLRPAPGATWRSI